MDSLNVPRTAFSFSGFLPDGLRGAEDGSLAGTPRALGGLSFVDVSVAGGDFGSHSCAITTGAAAYCWGFNGNGELGNGSTISSPTPVPVAGGLSLLTASAGRCW